MNIPRHNLATCLVKWRREELCSGAFWQRGLHLFDAKRLPRPSEGSVFLPPDFSGQATFIGCVRKSFRL